MKVLNLKVGFLFLGMMLTTFSWSQQNDSTFSMTLREAQDYALKNNLNKKNSVLDIAAAKKKVWETTAIGLPHIDGSASYQYIPGELPKFEFDMGGQDQLYQYIFNSLDSLGFPPPPELFQSDEEEESPTIAQKNSTTYSVTVSQLIFSGEYIVGLQASKTYLEISKISDEKTALDIKQSIAQSYFSVLTLEENLTIVDSSLENLQVTLNETKAMYNQGLLESTDVDQLELTINTLKNSKKVIERQVELSYRLLKIQLNINQDANLKLAEDLEKLKNEHIPQMLDKESFDATQTIDFKLIDNQERVAELNLKRQKSMSLPNLSAFYRYQDKINAPDLDFTINHVIGVNLNVPIFSSFQRSSQVQQKKIELQKTRNNKELVERNIKLQEQQARYDFNNALEKYHYNKRNVELSKKILKKTTIKYKQGMASSLEVTQTTNQYLDSHSKLNSALLELLNTKIKYDKLSNNL